MLRLVGADKRNFPPFRESGKRKTQRKEMWSEGSARGGGGEEEEEEEEEGSSGWVTIES